MTLATGCGTIDSRAATGSTLDWFNGAADDAPYFDLEITGAGNRSPLASVDSNAALGLFKVGVGGALAGATIMPGSACGEFGITLPR